MSRIFRYYTWRPIVDDDGLFERSRRPPHAADRRTESIRFAIPGRSWRERLARYTEPTSKLARRAYRRTTDLPQHTNASRGAQLSCDSPTLSRWSLIAGSRLPRNDTESCYCARRRRRRQCIVVSRKRFARRQQKERLAATTTIDHSGAGQRDDFSVAYVRAFTATR